MTGERWRERIRRVDWGHLPELAVLAAVLAVAALISYTHLRDVWSMVGAPWSGVGPLTVDGLFAAAWLRMRRRRRQEQEVGLLAWIGLGGALVATLAGNVAAAFPQWVTGHRNWVAPVVFAWAAVAFALVWELVTGHSRRQVFTPPAAKVEAPATDLAVPESEQPCDVQEDEPETPGVGLESLEAKVARLVDVERYGRKRLADALGVEVWRARQLLEEHRANCPACQEAAG